MNTFSPSDLALRCQRTLPDDTRAFEELVAHYKLRVFGIAYRLLGDRQEAEDQSQEVFIKVYRNIGRLAEPGTLNAWITQITVNTCRDALDKRQRRPQTVPIVAVNAAGDEHDLPIEDTQQLSPEEHVLVTEMRDCLEQTMAALDMDARTAIVLRDVEDRPYQEVAEVLTIGISAVKMRIHRARLTFQKLLEQICPDAATAVRRLAPLKEIARGQ